MRIPFVPLVAGLALFTAGLGVESDDAAVKRYDATDGGPMF